MTSEQRIDAKFCRICGADCTHRPRKKDPQGHYYCKACYEEAAHKTQLRRDKLSAAASRRDGEGLGLLNDLAGSTVHAVAIDEQRYCKGCNAKLRRGVATCPRCGHDTASGQHAESDDAAAPRASRSIAGARISPWLSFVAPILGHAAIFAVTLLVSTPALGLLPAIGFGLHAVVAYAITVRDGFRVGTLIGMLTLFFPPYTLYHALFDTEDKHARALTLSLIFAGMLAIAAHRISTAMVVAA